MHSATKYLGGHSDLTAGAVAGSGEFIKRARMISLRVGSTLDPAAAYLLSRGLKTLDVRVRAVCENALPPEDGGGETLLAEERQAPEIRSARGAASPLIAQNS